MESLTQVQRPEQREKAAHEAVHAPAPAELSPLPRSSARTKRTNPGRVFPAVGLLLGDVFAVTVAFYLAWFARYRLELGGDVERFNYVDFEVYLPIVAALAGMLVVILYLRRLYRLSRNVAIFDEFWAIFSSAALATMLLYSATTFARYPAESRATFIYAWVLGTVLVFLCRLIVRGSVALLHKRGLGVERVLVVGDNNLGRMIMQGLTSQPHLGYRVVGFLGDGGSANFGRFHCLGQLEDLEQTTLRHGIDEVIVALPSESHDSIIRIVDHCRRGSVRFRLVPDLYEMRLSQVDLETVYGIPLIGIKETSIRGWNLLVKRGLDVLISALGFVLLSVPMALIALAIKLDSPGPILYRQVRVGKGGKQFEMFKFRSMRVGAEHELDLLRALNVTEGPTFKAPGDPRRTRIGRILRRTSLDELPQLWNVLRGEMSLVGPRPPIPDEVAVYQDWHRKRLEVSPGLTGLWQVSGRSSLSFDEMVVLDIYYIENWSLGLDLGILLRTVPAVLSGGGAY